MRTILVVRRFKPLGGARESKLKSQGQRSPRNHAQNTKAGYFRNAFPAAAAAKKNALGRLSEQLTSVPEELNPFALV